jgi:hypothetical protein
MTMSKSKFHTVCLLHGRGGWPGGSVLKLQESLQAVCPEVRFFRLWFSQTSKLLINWGLPFFLRFPFSPPLVALVSAFLAFFRQRTALQLEILALRHQPGVLQRSVQRPKLTDADRFLWAWLSAVWTDWQPSAIIMKPATVIGWHRKGFRLFWT